ncbi:hypothetical protein FEM48_ZijujUnG0020800 [Ziziphus jujuba var. spinosa]|uniref:Reverse transcriptase Ty1/copia-type domain-containing protein n=1 Tax=Ziziphus jujuba var. spinosa TaxID=714518 RepID=A0A978U9T2_ZIZJJ|nr:hypothetical protein FEM48_ZijujUnG0020800 [Ziziphus jujuba var. spinosa]
MMRFSIDLIEFGKVFIIIQNSGAFDQDVLAGLSLESEPLCVRRLSTQSNSRAPIKEKVFAWAHHLMQNLFHNHHPSPITSHFKLFDSSGRGSLLYKGIPASEAALLFKPTSSADCQPVQVTSEDSSLPTQHVYSRRRLHYVSQAKTTPEDQQSSPVASPPVASSDSGSLSQVRRSSQVSYPVEGFLSYLMNRFPQNIELTSWFHCSRADSSMFVRRRHGRCLILLLYVDDNILTGNDSSLLFDFIKELGNQFVSFIRCITFSTWRYLAPPLDFA